MWIEEGGGGLRRGAMGCVTFPLLSAVSLVAIQLASSQNTHQNQSSKCHVSHVIAQIKMNAIWYV